LLKPDYTENKQGISVKSGAFKRAMSPKYQYELSEIQALGG